MTDFSHRHIADQLEATIRQQRPITTSAAWDAELIFPHYDALSLRNVPHTIADVLGVPLPQSAPVDAAIWDAAPPQNIQRVVAFLLDGLGYKHLHMLLDDDPDLRQVVADLTDGRGAVPLTSVAPSTTAVALSTLWTGGTPAATGMLGTLMYLREYQVIGNMIKFQPQTGNHAPDTLVRWGLTPDDLVALPGLAEHLQQQNIPSHLVTDGQLLGSGLSRILHRGIAQTHPHRSYSDALPRLREALQQTRGEAAYIGAYWSAVDSLAHTYGAHNAHTAREAKRQLTGLRDLLADPNVQDGQTLFMLLADHGHYDAPQRLEIREAADAAPLREAMTLGLTGDNRLAQMYLRPGSVDEVTAYIDETYADSLTYLRTDDALAAGVYGSEGQSPETRHRLGDLMLLPRLEHIVVDTNIADFPIVSYHGGLSDWEMLIPFMWRVL